MNRIRLLLSVVGLLAFALVVWFGGPLLAVAGRSPLDAEAARVAVIALSLLLWLGLLAWRIATARRAERRLAEGLGAAAPLASGVKAGDDTMVRALDDADAMRARFRDALTVLRRAPRGGNLASLPWYVLIGPPGAGKTTALHNAGLRFPLADRFGLDPLRGVGGTRDCDWWFAEEAVLIDTAGRYTTQDSDAKVDASGWRAFLSLLKRHRRGRPIDGIVVAIGVDELRDPACRARHAQAIRRRIREIDATLGLRVPVYVALTKADRIAGFADFHAALQRDERAQPWGFAFDANGADPVDAFAARFDALLARLNDRLLDRLDDERDDARRAALFAFPCEVARLKGEIAAFVGDVFGATRYDDATPWLRGVYFTSATSGIAPPPRAEDDDPDRTVVRAEGRAAAAAAGTRAFFVGELLTKVIIAEAGLVGIDRRAERRRAWLHGIATACAAGFVALGIAAWTRAHADGSASIARVRAATQAYESLAGAMTAPSDWSGLPARLDALTAIASSPQTTRHDFGLRPAAAVDAAARRAVQRELQRVLAPRVAATLAQAVREAKGEADPTYATLKGYLMLGDAAHRDPAYLEALMQLQWERELPRQPDAVARLWHHLDAWLAGRPEPVALDAGLVRDARIALNRVPLAELAYSRLKRDALAHDERPFVPADALGPAGVVAFRRASGARLDQPAVPGLYTARGYAEVFAPQASRLAQSLRADAWVLGSERGEVGIAELGSLSADVGRLYAADYVTAWRQFLSDLRVAEIQGTEPGSDALGALSGRNSALRALLLAVDRQTRPGAASPGADAAASKATEGFRQAKAELAQLLKPVQAAAAEARRADAATPARAAATLAVDPRPAAQIEAAFAELDALVQPDKDGRAPVDAIVERLAALYAELASLRLQPAAVEAGRSGVDGPAARAVLQLALTQPQPVQDWLMQLVRGGVQAADVQQADALQRKRSDDAKALREKLNAAWKADVLPFCLSATAHRYPVDRRSPTDMTLKDFGRLFGPGGLIDAFVRDHLRPFVDASAKPWKWKSADSIDLGASPSSLRALEIAAAVREAWFRDGGALPAADFAVRPVPAAGAAPLQSVSLAQGDQAWIDPAAPAAGRLVHWPANDGAGAPISLGLGGDAAEVRSTDGPWAWFRLLDNASVERTAPDRFVATFRDATHSARIELRASSVVNPFQPVGLERFECPRSF